MSGASHDRFVVPPTLRAPDAAGGSALLLPVSLISHVELQITQCGMRALQVLRGPSVKRFLVLFADLLVARAGRHELHHPQCADLFCTTPSAVEVWKKVQQVCPTSLQILEHLLRPKTWRGCRRCFSESTFQLPCQHKQELHGRHPQGQRLSRLIQRDLCRHVSRLSLTVALAPFLLFAFQLLLLLLLPLPLQLPSLADRSRSSSVTGAAFRKPSDTDSGQPSKLRITC